jgi:hypothetical protein
MTRLLIKREHQQNSSGPWRPPGIEDINWKLIWLNPRIAAVVDIDDYEKLQGKHWRLKRSGHCWYAARKVRTQHGDYWIKLHREIMNTPPGYDCHHKNKHTLDNRRENLENLTKDEHASRHLEFL